MPRVMVFLMTLMSVLPSDGSSQALPSPGDRIRIRQVDGTVLTGTLAAWSEETVQLSGESVDRRMEVPVSAIEALETSLGRSHRFGTYYGISVAASSILGGLVGLSRSGNASIGRGENAAGGLLLGYLVGIPLGAVIGSLVTGERWSPVAIPGSAQSGPTVRPVIAI